jgi:hypothetical protein
MNRRLTFPEQPVVENMPSPIIYVKEKRAWEYSRLIRPLGTPPAEEELNTLGAEGWELAGIFADSENVYFYFKRLAK